MIESQRWRDFRRPYSQGLKLSSCSEMFKWDTELNTLFTVCFQNPGVPLPAPRRGGREDVAGGRLQRRGEAAPEQTLGLRHAGDHDHPARVHRGLPLPPVQSGHRAVHTLPHRGSHADQVCVLCQVCLIVSGVFCVPHEYIEGSHYHLYSLGTVLSTYLPTGALTQIRCVSCVRRVLLCQACLIVSRVSYSVIVSGVFCVPHKYIEG